MASKIDAIDATRIRTKIEDELNRDAIHLRVVKAVLDALISQEGNKFTKRLSTCAKQALGDGYVVNYDDSHGSIYLNIWGRDISYQDRIHLHLGYRDSNRSECPPTYSDKASREMYARGYLNLEIVNEQKKKQLLTLNEHVNLFNRQVADFNAMLDVIGPLSKYL